MLGSRGRRQEVLLHQGREASHVRGHAVEAGRVRGARRGRPGEERHAGGHNHRLHHRQRRTRRGVQQERRI